MRHLSSIPISSGKIFWTTVLACLLQATLLVVATPTDETVNSRATDDDNLQIEADMAKRDWNKNLNLWGKRGWSNLHGGWGVKRSVPSWLEQNVFSSPPVVQKRTWKNFQGGWGKRTAPDNDELAIQEIAALLEQNDHQTLPIDPETDLLNENEEKRNWMKLGDGSGKRNKWESFRGAWGKREPAWVHLRGFWGKRSDMDSYVN